jgi:hypothetical protein
MGRRRSGRHCECAIKRDTAEFWPARTPACSISLRVSHQISFLLSTASRILCCWLGRATRLANDDPDGRVRHHDVRRYRCSVVVRCRCRPSSAVTDTVSLDHSRRRVRVAALLYTRLDTWRQHHT